VGCHFLLQGIFPTQGLNPGLLHCRDGKQTYKKTLRSICHQEKCKLKQSDTIASLLEWPKSRTMTMSNSAENVEQKKLSFINRNAKYYDPLWKRVLWLLILKEQP